MFNRLNQKDALLVIVSFCSLAVSMMVMLITYPKTIWIDAPNAGKLALLHIHNSFDDLQSFANVHAGSVAAKLYATQNFVRPHEQTLMDSAKSSLLNGTRTADLGHDIVQVHFTGDTPITK